LCITSMYYTKLYAHRTRIIKSIKIPLLPLLDSVQVLVLMVTVVSMEEADKLDVALRKIYDKLNKLIREMARSLGNVELIVVSADGVPIADYSAKPRSDERINEIASLLNGSLEGLQTLFTEILKLDISFGRDFLFLETQDSIIVLLHIGKATLLTHVRKPALLGTVRAIIKNYLPRISKLIEELQNVQNKLLVAEVYRDIIPQSK